MKSVGLWATRIGLMICVGIGAVELGSRVHAGDGAGDLERWRIQKGLEIAPMPLNLKGKDRELVGWEAISSTPCPPAVVATALAPRPNMQPITIHTLARLRRN